MTNDRGRRSNDDVIVIPSHVSGLKFLENLLNSFGTYDRYPIYLVINEYRVEVEPLFQELLAKFSHLPITLGRLESNSFEFGGLLWAYDHTPYQNFFLLPHSCEILDPRIFEISFEDYRGRSVVVFLQQLRDESQRWESHIGKYRREILTAIDFKRFQPHNIYQATYLSEVWFTRSYQLHEPTAFAFCRVSGQTGEVVVKFGKPRLKMSTPHLIKWKSHWSAAMMFRDFPKGQSKDLLISLGSFAIEKARGMARRIRRWLRTVW